MAVLLYTGLPRSGKTLFATIEGYKALIEGRKVYSNYWLNYKGTNLTYFTKINEILDVENAVILIDEISTIMHPRRFSDESDEVMNFWTYSGKNRLRIIINTQSPKLVPLTVRNVVDKWFHIRKLFQVPDKLLIVTHNQVDKVSLTTEEPKITFNFLDFLLNLKVYFNYELIGKAYNSFKDELISKLCVNSKTCGHTFHNLENTKTNQENWLQIKKNVCPVCKGKLIDIPSGLYDTFFMPNKEKTDFIVKKFKKASFEKLVEVK